MIQKSAPVVNLQDLVLAQMQQAASASAVGAPASNGNVPPPPAAAPSNTLLSTFVETDMEQQQDAQGYTDEFAKDLLGDFLDSADEKDQSLLPAKRARSQKQLLQLHLLCQVILSHQS